jgi:hypothetical protein
MGGNGQGRQVEQAVIDEMLRMRMRGCSYRTVQAILGVSQMTIAKYATDAAVDALRKRIADEREASRHDQSAQPTGVR